MTTVVDIEEARIRLKGLLAMAREGDEIVIEENGQELGKIVAAAEKRKAVNKRSAGLGRGTMSVADDFNDELPDEFWGFEK